MSDTLLEDRLSTIDTELATLVAEIGKHTIPISTEFPHRRGSAGTQNVFGEDQKALDVWVNEFLMEKLLDTNLVKTIVSEETPEPVTRGEGNFILTMDPLDGSSNIKSNNLFGTIVGVYENCKIPAKGNKLKAALYKLYGPITTLVVATKHGVDEFVASRKGSTKDRYILSRENIRIPEPKVYGVGGNPDEWIPEFEAFMRIIRSEGLKQRYGGSFVGDFNQILFHGGFFAYPALMKNPMGKLRLVFEAQPMSYIMKKAGGESSCGYCSLLDVKPKRMDQRVPVYVGNSELIESLEEIFDVCKKAREEF